MGLANDAIELPKRVLEIHVPSSIIVMSLYMLTLKDLKGLSVIVVG